MFNKILIANRGEIACRIIRTAHRLGIRCVAIYSEVDADALHVKQADEAYCIGPAPSRESYLQMDRIIEIAKKTQAEAIHPGYGFLAENAEFAKHCKQSNIIFIGPTAEAIHAMGSKSLAKEIMEKAGIPLVPGYHGEDQNLNVLEAAAEKIAYPVLLKAAAGGGGKGMRVVWQQNGFESALAAAKREALASFGDDRILVEKYLINPRHIEIQIFADQHGNFVHLFERDCSIQRRHQKIVEEAPASHLKPELRAAMAQTAIAAAKTINYVGAGTIELLLSEDEQFYFMEMNTRLQVEHPVTEFITQHDLVEWQLRVAAGEPLPVTQQELKVHGHAIEVRIYAEDPNHDFLPSTGKIKHLHAPLEDPHTRIDTGIIEGDEITPYYDPLITKLIVWDQNRELAISRLSQALNQYQIVGVKTNLELLSDIAVHTAFKNNKIDTHFIQNNYSELLPRNDVPNTTLALAALFALTLQQKAADDPWQTARNWRLNLAEKQQLRVFTDHEILIEVLFLTQGFELKIQDEIIKADEVQIEQDMITAQIDNRIEKAFIYFSNHILFILHAGQRFEITFENHDNYQHEQQTEIKSKLTAPMPGKVVAVLAKPHAEVKQGDSLAVIEAMKMEHTIYAPVNGRVKEWYFQVGDLVDEGVELLKFEEN